MRGVFGLCEDLCMLLVLDFLVCYGSVGIFGLLHSLGALCICGMFVFFGICDFVFVFCEFFMGCFVLGEAGRPSPF